MISDGFWEAVGEVLRGFGKGFAKALEDFGFLSWEPRAASLRPAERHNPHPIARLHTVRIVRITW